MNTPEARADMAKWVVWANAALDPVLFTRDIEVSVGVGVSGMKAGAPGC